MSESSGIEARPAAHSQPPIIPWRRNLYALCIAQVIAIMGFTLRESFMPFYLKDLGASSTGDAALWSGIVQAGGAGVMAFSAPFWGMMADRHGRRPMVLRAMFAAMCTVGLSAFATAPWQLLGLKMIEGGFTGTVAASTALIASTSPHHRMGYSLGMIQTAVFVGASFGPFLGGVFADLLGYRETFLIAAACLGMGGVIVLLLVREDFEPAPPSDVKRIDAVRASRSWLFAPMMIAMISVLFVSRVAQMGTRPITPLFISEIGNLSDSESATVAGIGFGAMGVTSAIASIYLGKRGDRVGHQKILLGSIIAAAAIYLPMAFVQTSWQMIVLLGLFGCAAGGLIPAANAIVADRTPREKRGTIFGVTASAGSIGAFVGPLICSPIAAFVGFRAAFAFVALLMVVLAAGLIYVLKRVQMESVEAAPAH